MNNSVNRLIITVLADNYCNTILPDTTVAKRFRIGPGESIHGEHGFSCHVSTPGGSVMFDFGLDSRGLMNNMKLLDIETKRIGAFVLSHGHFDHWQGLLPILEESARELTIGIPLYLGEGAFLNRFSRRPSAAEAADLGRLDRQGIESLRKIDIIEVSEPKEILPGCILTGPIERTTSYEHGSPDVLVESGEGLIQDQFPGEQALVCNVKDKGLVVLSGCAHAGIINTVRYAQKITGVSKIHAVLGGFHLANAPEDDIAQTVSDMKTLGPDYIIPTHCTGFESTTLFAKEMAERFILSAAGTRYIFGS